MPLCAGVEMVAPSKASAAAPAELVPVPPFVSGRTPVTLEARLTRAVEITPPVACRKPESEPMERDGVERAPVAEIVVVPVLPK